MDRRRLLQTSAAALALGLAGCGQGADDTEGPDDTPTPPPTDTPTDDGMADTETASPTPEPTDGSTATATPSPTPAETPTDAPTETPTATATPSPTPRAADQVVEVGPEGDEFAFVPDSFEIATGDTVVWAWRAGGHNVRPDSTPSGTDWEGTPGGDGDTYDEGYEHEHTFETAGDYEYYCAPHEGLGMVGEFTVTE